VDVDLNAYLAHLDERNADGLIMTFWADDPKWSYAKLSPEGWVTEVVEKRVVSNEATVGNLQLPSRFRLRGRRGRDDCRREAGER